MQYIYEITRATLRLFPVMTLCLCLFACGSDKTAAPEPAETPTEAPSQEEVLSPAEEQALSGEFQLQADERITAENAAEEAAKLEKEIEADLN